MSSIYVRGGPPDPLSLQLFENNRFIVMSKMQRGVHGWFQRETGVVRGARRRGGGRISIVRGLNFEHYDIQYAALVVFWQFFRALVKGIDVGKYKANLIKHAALAAAVACTLALTGCATTKAPPQTQVTNPDYLIGPGDTVNIMVWRNPEVSMAVPVRPDGKITTPLVEDLPAAGKTSTDLARDIEKALAKFIQQPVVTVIVTNFVGNFSEQIRVVGQATKPQALPYRRDMSLMDVMIAVGGVTEFASGNRASLIRVVDGKQQKYGVRLDDLIKDGDISANMPMRPGDVLVIPESFF
jgi:polysaccharide export outer membrane protein